MTAADTFSAVPVRVVDTYSLTMGQGLLVIAAAEEAAAGAGLDELVAATEDRIPRTRIYGVLGGLEHLQRGGRIGGARALLGSLLNIKPVIQLKDGEVAEESKQRTRARALAYLIDKVAADAPLERLAVADGACDDFADVMARLGGHRHRAPAAPGRPRAGRRHPRRAQHGGRLLHRSCQGRPGPPGSLTPWLRTTFPTRCRTVPSTTIDTVVATVNDRPSARPSWPPAASSSASSSPSSPSPSSCSSASASSA